MRKLWVVVLFLCFSFITMSPAVEAAVINEAGAASSVGENKCTPSDERCLTIQHSYFESFGRYADDAELAHWQGRNDWKTESDLITFHRGTLKDNQSLRDDTIRRSYTAVFWRGPYELEGNNELNYWSERLKATGMNYRELVDNHKQFITASSSFRKDLIINSYLVGVNREPSAEELQSKMESLQKAPLTFWQLLDEQRATIKNNPSIHGPIIEAAFQKALGRKPLATSNEENVWSNHMSANGTMFGELIDNLKGNLKNNQELRTDVIKRSYVEVFKREPREGEYTFWDTYVKNGILYDQLVAAHREWIQTNKDRITSNTSLMNSLAENGWTLDDIGNVVSIANGSILQPIGDFSVELSISPVVAAGGGNVIAAGGGNVIAAGGGNVIAAGGGNVIAAGGANVVAAGGGNVIIQGPMGYKLSTDTSTGLGTIAGRVTDERQMAIKGVKVTVSDQQGNFRGQTVTDINGNYVIEDLAAGEAYNLKADVKGLIFDYPDTVTVTSDQTSEISFYLDTLIQEVNISGSKLSRNMILLPQGGVAKVTGGTLDLNGFELRVLGDLVQSGGTINVNHGLLEVLGNYRIETPGTTGGTSSSGILEMVNGEITATGEIESKPDRVVVGKDFVMNSYYSHYDKLTGGVLEVKGDFSQKYGTQTNFYAGSRLKVILSGTEKQTVRFDNPYMSWSKFTELEITNISAAGVEFKTPVSVQNLHYSKETKLIAVSIMDWTLVQDEEIQGDLKLDENSSILDLAGNTLTIHGDLVHTGGKLDINHGKLIVKGDYLIENPNGSSSSGILEMLNGDVLPDTVVVEGDFVMNSYNSHYDKLTGGILEVKGNFSQKYGTQSNFYTGTKFKVILSGTSKQTVHFDNPYFNWSKFTELEITNVSTDGVVFETPVSVNYLHHSEGTKLTAFSIMDWKLTQDEVIHTNGAYKLEESSNTLNLNGHELIIQGNLIHTAGILAINHGKLIVKGDYLIEQLDGSSSSGILEMLYGDENPDTVLVEGHFVMNSYNSHTDKLAGGVLEVKGNFSQKYGTQSNFYAGNKFKVILSGTVKQTVHFDNPYINWSKFTELEMTNTSAEGVVFETPVSVNYLHHSEGMKLTASSILDWKLTQDEEIHTNGVYKLDESSNTLNLNGHKLTIHGKLVHTGGKLAVNHGKLIIEGDYLIENPDGSSSSGILEMLYGDELPDTVLVKGNFVMNSYNSHTDKLAGGVLEVKGNFSQKYGTQSNFYPGSNFKVILSGTAKQTVHFDNPYINWSKFTELEITNTSAEGVVFDTPVSVNYLHHSEGTKLTASSIMDWKLTQDEEIHTNGEYKLDESSNTLDLNGHKLTIHGKLVHTGGKLAVNHGKLIIEGDYLIENPDGSSSSGILEMLYGDENPDTVLVKGHFVMNSYNSHSDKLAGGVLEVKGNFSQKYGTQSNFYPGSNFKVILSGTAKQTVHFDNPYINWSKFTELEITNTSAEGVVFDTPVSVNYLHHSEGTKLTASSIMDWKLTQDEEIHTNGEYKLDESSNTLNLNGHKLTIHGKLVHTGGKLAVNHGKLTIKGDYLIEQPDGSSSSGILEMLNGDENPDTVLVEGHFVMNSIYSHYDKLTGGVLEVKGNFSQKYGTQSNFYAGSNFNVILSGTEKQTVHFDNPGLNYSRFNVLEIKNTSKEGVEFATDYYYEKLINDRVAPGKPVVNDVSDQDTTVTGEAESGSTVEVKVDGTVIGTGTAGEDGKFTVTITAQQAETELVITAKNAAEFVSEAAIVVVKDGTSPAAPVVNEVTDQDTSVTGEAEVGSKVEVKAGGTVIGSGIAGEDGNFTVTLTAAQSAGTELVITATDAVNNVSEETIIKVLDRTGPVIEGVENEGIYNQNVTVSFNEGTATLNGDPITSDAVVEAEGDYILVVKDEAENTVTVTFTIDKTTPKVTGVTNKAYYNKDVTVSFDEGTAELNGNSFTSGEVVKAEGDYTLVVTDEAGNSVSVIFTIDKTAPKVTGATNNAYYNKDVKVTFTEGTATLNGKTFTYGTLLKTAGVYTLIVTDAASNKTTVKFTIDKTAPKVTGVTNNAYYNKDVKVTFNEGKATLNGKTFTNGTLVKTAGVYTLIVTDTASNKTAVKFTIDKTAPKVTGVSNNTYVNKDVKLTFNEGKATLNGKTFNSGTVVKNAGVYTLVVTDYAGNKTTVKFIIDKTAPKVTGVKNKATYKNDVKITFNEGTATLNGKTFKSGTWVKKAGSYTLIVTDGAGNKTTVKFTRK